MHLSVSPTALQAFNGIISDVSSHVKLIYLVVASHRGLSDQVHHPACGWGSSLIAGLSDTGTN